MTKWWQLARYLIARTTSHSCAGYKRPKRKIMHTTLARTTAPVLKVTMYGQSKELLNVLERKDQNIAQLYSSQIESI